MLLCGTKRKDGGCDELRLRSIAIITPARFPGTSGETATLTELVQELASSGIQVTLICPKTSQSTFSFDAKNLEVVRIPHIPPRLNEISKGINFMQKLHFLIFLISETWVTVWKLKRKRIKHVILRPSILTIQLPPILRLFGIIVIADITELIGDSLGPHVGSKLQKIIGALETRILTYYSFFKVSSQSQAEELKKKFAIPESRIIHMPFSIDISKIPRTAVFDIPSNTFGFFGVLESWQGVDLLVDAFQLLVTRIPSAKLFIIGEGSLKNIIREQISQRGLSQSIMLIKGVTRETLWETYFRKFRVVVIPRPRQNNSIDFILPVKLIEAMAAAKPIIASDIPVFREMPKDEILLFDSGDPKSLATCMERLCYDDDFLQRLSKNAAIGSQKYDIRVNIKKIISILGE